MNKDQRIARIKEQPEGSIFIVRAPNEMFWKQGDHGYTEDIREARKFTKLEILEMLQANGLMDKSIEVFTKAQSV